MTRGDRRRGCVVVELESVLSSDASRTDSPSAQFASHSGAIGCARRAATDRAGFSIAGWCYSWTWVLARLPWFAGRAWHSPRPTATRLGAPRLGECSVVVPSARTARARRAQRAVRPPRSDAGRQGLGIVLDARLADRFPYVAVLLRELSRDSARAESSRPEIRPRRGAVR